MPKIGIFSFSCFQNLYSLGDHQNLDCLVNDFISCNKKSKAVCRSEHTITCCVVFMLSGLQAGTEYMCSPITPLMDKSAHARPHRKNGRNPSTTSTISKGRLYYYVSGSDADDDDNETSSSGNRKQNKQWRKGSHSTVSSSNDIDNCRFRNDHVSQLSLSDSEQEEAPSQYSQTGNSSLIRF